MGRVFEDFPVGSRFVSRREVLTREEIIAFAQRYDPQPFHLGTALGENLLGGLAASGWQTAAVSMRLFIDMMQVEGGIIGRALDELRWPLAVHPGDSIRVEIEIMEARLSESKPGYGLIRYRSLTLNQDDKVVQSFIALAVLRTRSGFSETMGGEGIEPPTNTV
ncbi:MAG: MaoC family dehydratase [Chthoniobacterales bacterium]